MSIVPTATERSPCPPGFSFVIIVAQIVVGIEIVAGVVQQAFGSASRMRGAKRSRIRPPWP